jgi:nucleotide-binding universal stress UspA family protein
MNKQPYQRILVAYDGSKSAEKALELAAEFARENDIQLDILYALDTSIAGFGNTHVALSGDDLYLFEEKAISNLDEIKKRLVAEGSSIYQVHVHLRMGDPRTIIAKEFPGEYRNDLIVLGSSTKNRLQRIFTGSVSSYVIRTAACDSLIIR